MYIYTSILRASYSSLGCVESNIKAIENKGPGPSNRYLLTNEEIFKAKPSDKEGPTEMKSNTTTNKVETPTQTTPNIPTRKCNTILKIINLSTGIVGTWMIDLLQNTIKSNAVHKNLHNRRRKGKSICKEFLLRKKQGPLVECLNAQKLF